MPKIIAQVAEDTRTSIEPEQAPPEQTDSGYSSTPPPRSKLRSVREESIRDVIEVKKFLNVTGRQGKRSRAVLSKEEEEEEDQEEEDQEVCARELDDIDETSTAINKEKPPPTGTKRLCVGIRPPPLCTPKSVYEGWRREDGMTPWKERTVLASFQLAEEADRKAAAAAVLADNPDEMQVDDEDVYEARRRRRRRKDAVATQTNEFTSYILTQFSVYHPAYVKRVGGEMAGLHNLSVAAGKDIMLFDGVLSNGTTKYYVEGVPFDRLSIGNYGDLSAHGVGGAIWIQSVVARGYGDVWYELGAPAPEYERYHTPFVWIANFAKFFIDYIENHDNVVLEDFRTRFGEWICGLHGGMKEFEQWRAQFGRDDYRQVITANHPFLWNQAYNMEGAGPKVTRHPIWAEVMLMTAVKPAPGKLISETIVTPLVYECFRDIFGDKLKRVAPKTPYPTNTGQLILDQVEIVNPTRVQRDESGRILVTTLSDKRLANIKPGDVIAVNKDAGSRWKGKSEYWYAYVQAINRNSRNWGDTLDVIWLYLPEDTILGQMYYPYANELFFSNNCNCGDASLRLDDVVFIASTAMFVGPEDDAARAAEFFIRQKFSDSESNFTTLRREDLKCECRKLVRPVYEEVKRIYAPNDTVLVESSDDEFGDRLEPAQIIKFEDDIQQVHVRLLYRRARDLPNLSVRVSGVDEDGSFKRPAPARPNELVYTHITAAVSPDLIVRRCHIRFFPPGARPITPYDRDGVADCFYINYSLEKREDVEFLQPVNQAIPLTFKLGFDPEVVPEGCTQLNGMDLFCGGGNFGRGIEEGGAVRNRWAVDLDVPALHTYRANLRHLDTHLYLGSVNNYLNDGLQGKFSAAIPAPGEVDFISAGSPCQGFSSANQDRNSDKSLRNSSLVASVASFVDFYRPKFALLENVHGLATNRVYKMPDGTKQECNVFSQLLCSLVAIGYQCQQFTLDAWSFGSCQTRTRLFVSVAAPGQRLPPKPARSHTHPSEVRSKALFEAPNGKKFGERELEGSCTFPFVTSQEVFGNLPNIGDSHPAICIPWPDHRNSRIEATDTRLLMKHIPKGTPGDVITSFNRQRRNAARP